jgi:hypothetical protein
VLEDIGWTLLAYAIAFVINIVPAFMPSTWMVLAFFHIQFDLPILPLTIGGAFFSGLGRIVLAKFSSLYTRHVRKRDKELDEIKTYLDRRRNGVGVATFFYCLLPLDEQPLRGGRDDRGEHAAGDDRLLGWARHRGYVLCLDDKQGVR